LQEYFQAEEFQGVGQGVSAFLPAAAHENWGAEVIQANDRASHLPEPRGRRYRSCMV
jgi:hypothetical protein